MSDPDEVTSVLNSLRPIAWESAGNPTVYFIGPTMEIPLDGIWVKDERVEIMRSCVRMDFIMQRDTLTKHSRLRSHSTLNSHCACPLQPQTGTTRSQKTEHFHLALITIHCTPHFLNIWLVRAYCLLIIQFTTCNIWAFSLQVNSVLSSALSQPHSLQTLGLWHVFHQCQG